MSSANGQPMQCDAVEARLLDLVYGELADDEAASVRAHAEGCESCSRSLGKLEGGRAIARKMQTEDAPPAVMAAVMAAARAKAGENQRAAARARIEQTERERAEARTPARARTGAREGREGGSWLSEFLRKLGSFATGPQVAMAMLLLLMVGIGLWSAPRMTGRERSDSQAVLEPDPDGEVGPSAGALTPAEPLRLEVDPRTDRIVEAEQAEERAAPEREGRSTERPVVARTEGERSETRRTVPETGEGEAVEDERLADVAGELAPGEAFGGVEDGELPEPEGTGTSVAALERTAPPTAMAPVAPPPVTGPPPSTSPSPSARSAPPPDSVEAPQLDTSEALAASLHQQAREAGSNGRYAQCVSSYQQVLDRYPAYAQTGRALIEMAECQRRLGQITVAERTLERAQRYAAVRPDAERRLSTLRAEREAMDRARAAEIRSGTDRAAAAEPASAY